MLITGKKADGRYIVVGKKGEKSARDAADLGVTKKEEVVGIDIDDLHQEMLESLKQARKNVGASKCWDGYKAKGTKTKGGKQVPNCVKEDEKGNDQFINKLSASGLFSEAELQKWERWNETRWSQRIISKDNQKR